MFGYSFGVYTTGSNVCCAGFCGFFSFGGGSGRGAGPPSCTDAGSKAGYNAAGWEHIAGEKQLLGIGDKQIGLPSQTFIDKSGRGRREASLDWDAALRWRWAEL